MIMVVDGNMTSGTKNVQSNIICKIGVINCGYFWRILLATERILNMKIETRVYPGKSFK